MKLVLIVTVVTLCAALVLNETGKPRYFPRDSKEYVVFCVPDTITGHKPETHECGLNRKAYTVYNLDYPVIMCDSCFPEKK